MPYIAQSSASHPAILHAESIKAICRPLNLLNIDYFCHVNIDRVGKFSALGSNPQFSEQYLKNKYYNIDIHTAKDINTNQYVVWDMFEPTGKSLDMEELASGLGIKHTFSIVKMSETGKDFFHFASSTAGRSINQVYVNQVDLLEAFIANFKDQVKRSRELRVAYDIKYGIDPKSPGYTMESDENILIGPSLRQAFLQQIHVSSIQQKMTEIPVTLTAQRLRCLSLLVEGNSAKEIAKLLQISPRTAEHHIEFLRKSLGCRSSKEIIATYGGIGSRY